MNDINIWNEAWYPEDNDDETKPKEKPKMINEIDHMWNEDLGDENEYDPGELDFLVPEIIQPRDMRSFIADGGIYYRSPGDDINVKRIFSKVPDLCVRIALNVAVKGVSYRTEQVNRFVLDNPTHLSLVPEPTNNYDKNAIMIIGHYTDQDGEEKQEHIGYVAKETAAKHVGTPLIAQLLLVYVPHDGKSAGVRFSLWKPGKPKGAMI